MRRLRIVLASWVAMCAMAFGQNPPSKPAESLYLQLRQVGLDPARVYKIREATLDRSAIHLTLEDGTIAFTQDVMGRITGAFFEGEGEVLLVPPSAVERRSMSLFTGMAILEEHFATAYFRFNDDIYTELRPGLRATDEPEQFVDRWNPTAKNLANDDAMRLLITFSRMLPVNGNPAPADNSQAAASDRYFHARLQGTKLGIFDVSFDSHLDEQIQAGQAKPGDNGVTYYNVWTSFSPDAKDAKHSPAKATTEKHEEPTDWIAIRRYKITTEVQPPKLIHAHAQVQLEARESGRRALLFELSRFLQVESVKLNGEAVEFIHNPAVEGTQLSRRGNDAVALILPEPAKAGEKMDLDFDYGGEVLAEAGGGLLYVGARGAWYPNRGMSMADYDLQFEYPQGWTLVATGKPTAVSPSDAAKQKAEQVSHWVSERPMPLAGFNLGKYRVATAHAGDVTVQTYAAVGVERDFPNTSIQIAEPQTSDPNSPMPAVTLPYHPSPAQNEQVVAQTAAQAIEYYAARFGPYPYSSLSLTQIPGRESQGWPGLVFLSSYAFLTVQEREQMHYSPVRILLQQLIPAHEAAHQWWGDLITWDNYRDQWFSEGLANYSALMILEEKDPAGFRQIMQEYRQDLVTPDKDGMAPKDAGPVTLGGRLESSRFPGGYDAISYGRSSWLFHMLRTMLDDGATLDGHRAEIGTADDPFVRALRRFRERYQGQAITTRELLQVFAQDLPPALRYEGKESLDWFLDGWVNGTSLPKLELKSVKLTPKGSGLVISGTILQKDAPEDLVTSVPVYGLRTGRQPMLLGRVFADGEESSFRINAPAGVHKILLDPEQTILTAPK